MFFFLWHGDDRDLRVLTRSFPTRRSSDLIHEPQRHQLAHADARETIGNQAPFTPFDDAHADTDLKFRKFQGAISGAMATARWWCAHTRRSQACGESDRKSTRLNSSH